MRGWGTSWHYRPATSISNKGGPTKGAWAPSPPLALPSPCSLLGGGPSGLPRGAVVELEGHSVQKGKGPGHSCFENLFGLGTWETWGAGERWREGTWGTLAFDRVFVRSPMPRSGIRFLWTQCAQGGKGSRLSSPRHVGGWVCWHPLRPHVHAAAARAAGCAGTSPHSSAAAASGTR